MYELVRTLQYKYSILISEIRMSHYLNSIISVIMITLIFDVTGPFTLHPSYCGSSAWFLAWTT